ncbi:hypothetical protein K9L97_03925 [Candidatus Woesearchaeota archaeon]|nr:hypothetical protein [Candidatus Woesearchaeota archaeon]
MTLIKQTNSKNKTLIERIDEKIIALHKQTGIKILKKTNLTPEQLTKTLYAASTAGYISGALFSNLPINEVIAANTTYSIFNEVNAKTQKENENISLKLNIPKNTYKIINCILCTTGIILTATGIVATLTGIISNDRETTIQGMYLLNTGAGTTIYSSGNYMSQTKIVQTKKIK